MYKSSLLCLFIVVLGIVLRTFGVQVIVTSCKPWSRLFVRGVYKGRDPCSGARLCTTCFDHGSCL